MNPTMRVLALPVALAGVLTVSACGGTDPGSHDMSNHSSTATAAATGGTTASGTPAAGAHNDADVAFATGMIPHHGQALTMADLALKSAGNAQVKALAEQVKDAQDPEIRQMSGWLRGWGEPVPEAQGMNHDAGMHGEGMMSVEEMDALGKATGATFDGMWLTMMIRHHEGAVAAARTELAAGSNTESKALAQAIIDGQTKEIATMKGLQAQLSG
ncbi:DUF305 domain-containing protein [Terrabacter sp. GCM10028922]|uniref:DUF305 domain-containing protein n=1 Tax=Terrabacter sp. GCM10028922 TaxID=3273428 RepID=UPI00360BC87A